HQLILELGQWPGSGSAWPLSLIPHRSRRVHGYDGLDARPTALTGGHHDHVVLAEVRVRVDLLALLEGAAGQPRQHLAAAVLGAGGGAGDPAGGLARLRAGSDGKLSAQSRRVALLLVLGLGLDALERRGVVADGHATAADNEYSHLNHLESKGTNRWPG